MRYFFVLSILFISCKKEAVPPPETYSETSYKMIITVNWIAPQFGVPANAHVTAITGMVHSNNAFLWRPGGLSTKGLEDVAEIGNTTNINTEMAAFIAGGKALKKFSIAPPDITGSAELMIDVNTNFPLISFTSMIAPSPDWFMGVHDVSLFENNKWITDTTLNIYTYDAGTEEGDAFKYDNPDTNPQKTIGLLTPLNASVLANGNAMIPPIATVRFIRIN